MPRPLVVKTGAGPAAPERCVMPFTVAVTALASGAEVTLWLIGDAVDLAVPGGADAVELEGSPPLASLLETLAAADALVVCAQCAARRGLTADDLVPGARIAGAATYVEQILQPDVQALVY